MKESTITGKKLTHLTHTEELLLYGEEAALFALRGLYGVYDTLQGNTDEELVNVTVKWDGSPSCMAASDFHGEAFVATKGIFAKDRKIAYTPEDCERLYGHAPDLQRKMTYLLEELPKIGIPQNEIWQGDFLFDSSSLAQKEIQGESCLVFHPNTIVYAVPTNTDFGRQIREARIGVTWHTRYTGPDFDNLDISFDVSKDELNETDSVISMDAKLPSMAGIITLTEEESEEISSLLASLTENVEDLIADGFIEEVAIKPTLQLQLMTFQNSLIRKGFQFRDDYFDDFIKWITDRFDTEIEKKKQQKTRDRYEAKKQETIAYLESNKQNINDIIEAQKLVVKIKNIFIAKLDSLSSRTIRTFFNTLDQGYISTGQEGYAVSDIDGNVQKIVDRLEFSRGNFSKDIIKGWMSDKRLDESIVMEEKMTRDQVYSFINNTFKDRMEFKKTPKADRGGTFEILDKENSREAAAKEALKAVANEADAENFKLTRQGKDLVIDDWLIKFKNKKTSEGNVGHDFENILAEALLNKDLSNNIVKSIDDILRQDYNTSIDALENVRLVGGANVSKALHKASLEKGKLVVLPPALRDSGLIDGDKIGEALADIVIDYKDQSVPLSLKSGSKISFINSGLSWGQRGNTTTRFKTIAAICRILSPDIDINKVLTGFYAYQEAFEQGRSKSIKKPMVAENIKLDQSVWKEFITSALGWGYIMVHDDHVTNVTKELTSAIANEKVQATVAYPHEGKGRFEIHIRSSYIKKPQIVIRDTSAKGLPDKLLIEYGGLI